MKLAVIGDEVSQDPALVADTAVQLGFAGIEVRSLEDTPPHLLTDEQVTRVRTGLADRGLAVAGFAPPIFKGALPRTDEELAAAADVVVRSIDRAMLLGAPHIRIFTFFRDGDPDPVLAARTAATLLAGMEVPIGLVVETEGRTNTPTMRHVLAFLDELGREDVGVLWDPANCVFGGWEHPFPGGYLLGRERIRHVHVKDPDGTRGYVRLGDGDLDWTAILARLAEDGYSGFVSLETHWRHGRVLTAAHRERPWGESFSSGGYAASVECMQRLCGWVDQTSRERP
jgi:sugar phosphate isomerase/epimerase